MKSTFKVEGMSCGHCINRVSQALQSIPGITVLSINLSSGIAQLELAGLPNLKELQAALSAAGAYEISQIEEAKP